MKFFCNMTSVRIVSTFTTIALLMSLFSCGQGDDPTEDTAVSTTKATTTTASVEQTVTTTVAYKDPAEEVPFTGLHPNDTMLEFQYQYISYNGTDFVLRYGIFSTAEKGYLNGTGIYMDFLDKDLQYVSSYRYPGVGFIALLGGTNGEQPVIVTHNLHTYNDATFTGDTHRMYYSFDNTLSSHEYVNIPTFTLDRYGERGFFMFISEAPDSLSKAKGARILAYHDGTQCVLTEPDAQLSVDDTVIQTIENLTMKEIADCFGLEYKG